MPIPPLLLPALPFFCFFASGCATVARSERPADVRTRLAGVAAGLFPSHGVLPALLFAGERAEEEDDDCEFRVRFVDVEGVSCSRRLAAVVAEPGPARTGVSKSRSDVADASA